MIEETVMDMFPPESLHFSYDEATDVLTIEGIKYHGDFFRVMSISGPSDKLFKIVAKSDDGGLTIKAITEWGEENDKPEN